MENTCWCDLRQKLKSTKHKINIVQAEFGHFFYFDIKNGNVRTNSTFHTINRVEKGIYYITDIAHRRKIPKNKTISHIRPDSELRVGMCPAPWRYGLKADKYKI